MINHIFCFHVHVQTGFPGYNLKVLVLIHEFLDDIHLTSWILLEGLAHLMMKILGPLLQLELNTDILKIFIENLVLMSSLQIDDIYHKM